MQLKALTTSIAIVAAATCLAHTDLHIVCGQSKLGGVKVDGDIAAWQEGRFVAVPATSRSFGHVGSDDDASFRFAAMWDRWYLYVAVEVKDDSIVAAKTLARLYEGDCVEISLDAHNDSTGGYDAGDFQFVIAPTGPERKPRVNLYRNPFFKIGDRPFVKVASNITTTGYVVEAAFSWRQLGVRPRTGHVVGFQIDIRDYDADGSRGGLTWAPASDPAANPLRWGDLILASSPGSDVSGILRRLAAKNARWQRLLEGKARELDNNVGIRVLPNVIGRLSLGVGWNVQFRDGRFPAWDEGAWSAFLELLAWTQPSWIRYGVNLGQWEPANDDDDPSHPNWPAFKFRSPAMLNHYRLLDLCEKRGIDVLWANWCIGDRATGAKWLAESVHNPENSDGDDDPYNDAPYDPEELAESIAACLYHLKSVRGYTCVKQVSLWNEPDQGWSFNSPSAKYPETFWTYYDALARHLRRLGLRDAVKILGPETSPASYDQLPELGKFLSLYSDEVDILAFHDYIGYADYRRVDRGVPISRAAVPYAELATITPRPVAVTEFGNMGNGSGEVSGLSAVWAGSLSTCRLVIEALNYGAAGFLRWEFKPYGASWQNFGALTTVSREHLFAPYRPVFFPHALLCRAMVRGAEVLKTVVNGGRDENGVGRVVCVALQQRDTGHALILLNDGLEPKRARVQFDPKVFGRSAVRFGHLSYDASLPSTFRKHSDVEVKDGAFELTLPPRSVHALSTRPDFADVKPLPTLPPRLEPRYYVRKSDDKLLDVAFMRFNGDYDWRVWQSTAGHSTLATRTEQGEEKNKVCRIAYEMLGVREGQRPEHLVAHTDLILRGRPLRVSARFKGDGRGLKVAFLFVDARGEVFQAPEERAITWEGWKRISLTADNFPEGWHHWSGDGKPDYPLLGFGITLTAPDTTFRGRGILEMDDVLILSEVPKPAATSRTRHSSKSTKPKAPRQKKTQPSRPPKPTAPKADD